MGRPSAVLHDRVDALAFSARSFARALIATPFQLPPHLPRLAIQTPPRICVCDLKTKRLAQDEFQSVSVRLSNAVSSSRFVVECNLLLTQYTTVVGPLSAHG